MTGFLAGLIVLGLLQLADVYSTNRMIAAGSGEANPWIAWSMKRFGSAWWVFKLGIAAAFISGIYAVGPWSTDFLGFHFDQPLPLGYVVLAGMIGFYSYAVWFNMKVALRREAHRHDPSPRK